MTTSSVPQPSPDAFARHLQAAEGFIELGMYLDANEELEQIDAERRTHQQVLELRGKIYLNLQKWELLQTVTAKLMRVVPKAHHWLWLATAAEKIGSVEEAYSILMEGIRAYPRDAHLLYALAARECALGKVKAARVRLTQAFKHDSSLRLKSLDDPALEPVWRDCIDGLD